MIVFSLQTDVEIIVFLAIMLHKAPASFGLGRPFLNPFIL